MLYTDDNVILKRKCSVINHLCCCIVSKSQIVLETLQWKQITIILGHPFKMSYKYLDLKFKITIPIFKNVFDSENSSKKIYSLVTQNK